VAAPFRYVRNPGYVGVVGMVIGEALLLGSAGVPIYASAIALGFHLFALLYEEPHLRRRFGKEYEQSCREFRDGSRAGATRGAFHSDFDPNHRPPLRMPAQP
jgi:protein-S-isoprenylcysteine O-methyltransferase Ste14